MEQGNYPLRLHPSLLEEARRVATEEGVDLNDLISEAVAEKVSTLRSDGYFRERAERANLPAALEVLRRPGADREPIPGDELPE